MAKRPANPIHCSFCGKPSDEVRKLIAGPRVYICDECIAFAVEILREEQEDSDANAPCALCRQPIQSTDRLRVTGHGVLCAGCANAVVAAALKEAEAARPPKNPKGK